jgi:hypothetical protein
MTSRLELRHSAARFAAYPALAGWSVCFLLAGIAVRFESR